MDSAVCLRRVALHIPSTISPVARLARPYSSLRPSLSLFSKASTYRTLSLHTFSSPAICALNKPSPPSPNYDKDNGKTIVRVVGGASVVLACALGVINYNFHFSPSAIAGPSSRSHSQTQGDVTVVVSKPKDVLDSLLKVNSRQSSAAPAKSKWFKRSSTPTKKLSIPGDRPTQEDLDNFKNAVADLIKSGKLDEAEAQLKRIYQELKGGVVGNEVDFQLVLVLIFQGRYEDALRCDCLSQRAGVSSDGRVHFYKAIIHTMLEQDEAAEAWNKFVESFSNQLPDFGKSRSEVQTQKEPRNIS